MSITLKRQAFGKYQGDQKTVYAGDGLTFRDYTPYTLGDDFRRIDWRVYARTKELFVKRYEEDRNLTIHILVDGSGSMAYDKQKKFSYAATMALGVAHIAQKHHERVAVSVFGKDLTQLKRENQNIPVVNLIQQASKIRAHGITEFEEAMKKYKDKVKTKSLFFIFSDFLYPLSSLSRLLQMYEKSEVFLVQVLHEDEVELPFKGEYKFVDPEVEGNHLKVYVSPKLRSLYSKEMNFHCGNLQKICREKNVKYLQLSTKEGILDGFLKLWRMI